MKTSLRIISLFLFVVSAASAQDAMEYQKPPQAIATIMSAIPSRIILD